MHAVGLASGCCTEWGSVVGDSQGFALMGAWRPVPPPWTQASAPAVPPAGQLHPGASRHHVGHRLSPRRTQKGSVVSEASIVISHSSSHEKDSGWQSVPYQMSQGRKRGTAHSLCSPEPSSGPRLHDTSKEGSVAFSCCLSESHFAFKPCMVEGTQTGLWTTALAALNGSSLLFD